MNKSELIISVASKSELTKADTEKFLKAFEEVVTDELVSDGKVQLTGFLTLDVVDKAARTARNPKTGEEIKVPAKKAPRVKIGKSLKDAVNGK